jgi:hypothetical protein
MALCFGMASCAAQRDDSLRLSEELGRARADAAWQEARATEFEARMSRLEQRANAALSIQRSEERALSSRIDRLLEMNERLLAERSAAALPTSGALGGTPTTGAVPAAATSTASNEPPGQNDEQALRALVERLRGRPGSPHGGLTREQEAALRVLSRPERKLDAENPWAAFY